MPSSAVRPQHVGKILSVAVSRHGLYRVLPKPPVAILLHACMCTRCLRACLCTTWPAGNICWGWIPENTWCIAGVGHVLRSHRVTWCRLVQIFEEFKATREECKAHHIALMILGLMPWLDPDFCRKYPDWLHGFQRYGDEWNKHVMRCPHHEPREQLHAAWERVLRPASDAVNAGDPEPFLDEVPGWFPVYCHPCIMDLLYQVDEYTRWLCRTKPQKGKRVFKLKAEQLPIYRSKDCNISPSSADAHKLHFCNVVGPSGLLCTFILSSGSSQKLRRAAETPLWWDLVPMKLTSEDMPGGEDPEVVRARMASKTWQVCTQLVAMPLTTDPHPQNHD